MGTISQHKIRRKRLSEQLTAQLRKYIVDHDLKPGDPLLTEQQMVERFGVSHTVVREATKALDFLGIIDAAPRRGMVLDEFDFDRVSEYFGFHFALSDYPKQKLLKARAVIETGALFYTMEAMKEDPALYPQLRKLAEALPTRTTLMVGGLSTTSPFIGGWLTPATFLRWRRFAICSRRSFTSFARTWATSGKAEKAIAGLWRRSGGRSGSGHEVARNHLSFYERNVSP